MTKRARGRRIIAGWVMVPVALAVATFLMLWLKPSVGRAVFGERPAPVLAAIREEAAVTLAPHGLILDHEDEQAASGTVAVSRHYAYPSAPDPGA